MSSISSQRPFFPPASSGQGGGAPVNATKILREAQAAFFRPSAATPQVTPEPEPEAAAVAPSAFKRPGSYLDIRV